MGKIHRHSNVILRTTFGILTLVLLQTSVRAKICTHPEDVQFPENNRVGDVVANITLQPGVTVSFRDPPPENYAFTLEGGQLKAARVFDSEAGDTSETVRITCTTDTGAMLRGTIIVIITGVNDNGPVFAKSSYSVSVFEMTPEDTSVARIEATDLDKDTLFYTLTSDYVENPFKLQTANNPNILVVTPLEYDKVKNVTLLLTARDRQDMTEDGTPKFTANTTIIITILDVDNRPPWFQPCIEHTIGGILICQSEGYTGRVVLGEQQTGPLPLEPGPIKAVDGDKGINAAITYSFLSGNELFQINADTGIITMRKPADVLGTISLTVVAAQTLNRNQFATTSIKFSVQIKSLHKPTFAKPLYEGVITAVGVMAMDAKDKDQPLQIVATDEDYAATGGLNPHITYKVTGRSDFDIINGFLFMTKDLPDTSYPLQVVATDTSNGETATAQLSVEVASGPNTTSSPPITPNTVPATSDPGTTADVTTNPGTTGDTIVTTNIPGTTGDTIVTTNIPGTTVDIIVTTNIPGTTDDILPTTNPGPTTDVIIPTTNSGTTHDVIIPTTGPITTADVIVPTTNPVIAPPGGYSSAEMAAIGASLGVLLFISLVVIGLLIFHIRRGKADWNKLYETSLFRSSLGKKSGSPNKGIHYTNEAFQKDEDGDGPGSPGPAGGTAMSVIKPEKPAANSSAPSGVDVVKSAVTLNATLLDNASQTSADQAEDGEKEVKPILTKERRVDEGYKSVWFKEDIDPNAMEEVVIIPDSREHEQDSEEEEEEEEERGERSTSGREEEDEDESEVKRKSPRVLFSETDLDSGLGVRIDDPADNSEGDQWLNVDL